MKVLVVDDEQPARERLKQLLSDEADYEYVGEAANGNDAVRLAAELEPDIVLLDIRMPGLDGIETAHHLAAMEHPPAVVFATAYDEYAIDAFDARAVGYVLKPVRRARLTAALDQASKLAPSKLTSVAAEARLPVTRQYVCARSHGKLRLIPVAEIHCFRADQKYVTVDHDDGRDLIDEPLIKLAEEFSDDFVRIHRSALVALKYIDRIEKTGDGKSLVVLRENSQVEDKELIISRRHLAEVRRRLKGG
jgi:two-component system response regulator AlgR